MAKRPDVAERNKSLKQRESVSLSHCDGKRKDVYKNISLSMLGNTNGAGSKHPHSPETIEKIRANTPVRRKEQHSMWKGGITGQQRIERNSVRMKEWIKGVMKRDDYTCQACGVKGGKLEADHVMPFSLFPELRYDLLNGRTLCVQCHRKTFITKELKRQLLGFQLP